MRKNGQKMSERSSLYLLNETCCLTTSGEEKHPFYRLSLPQAPRTVNVCNKDVSEPARKRKKKQANHSYHSFDDKGEQLARFPVVSRTFIHFFPRKDAPRFSHSHTWRSFPDSLSVFLRARFSSFPSLARGDFFFLMLGTRWLCVCDKKETRHLSHGYNAWGNCNSRKKYFPL